MAVRFSLPAVALDPGHYEFPPFTLDVDCDEIEIAVGRAGLPEGDVATALLDLSQDAGENWTSLGGISLGGGDVFDKAGQLATESSYRIGFVDPATGAPIPFSASDLVRATVDVQQSIVVPIEIRTLP